MRDERLSDEEMAALEKKLVEVVGTDPCDVADFATRAVIRLLGHARAVDRENAALRRTVGTNLRAVAQG